MGGRCVRCDTPSRTRVSWPKIGMRREQDICENCYIQWMMFSDLLAILGLV